MSLAGSQTTLDAARETARSAFSTLVDTRETLLDSIEDTTGLEAKVENFRTARDTMRANLKAAAAAGRANNAFLRAL